MAIKAGKRSVKRRKSIFAVTLSLGGARLPVDSGSQTPSLNQSFYCILEMIVDVGICCWEVSTIVNGM